MGGGDLNLKKSWHPSTMKNMEKVWKAEQEKNQEKKRIAELKREIAMERDREDMTKYAMEQGVIEKKDDKKLDWMYKGPNEMVNREEYLLGRPIDKSFEQVAQAQKDTDLNRAPKNHVEYECIPPSLRFFSGNEQVDLARKMQEDPLYAIKKKEMETRSQLLKNPVKLKKIKELLEQQTKKKEIKKKSKKKKSTNNTDNSDDETELDNLLAAKYKQLKDKISEKHLMKSMKKIKHKKRKKSKKVSSDSESDSSSESDSDNESSSSDSDSNSSSSSSTNELVKRKKRKRSHKKRSSSNDSGTMHRKRSKKKDNEKKEKHTKSSTYKSDEEDGKKLLNRSTNAYHTKSDRTFKKEKEYQYRRNTGHREDSSYKDNENNKKRYKERPSVEKYFDESHKKKSHHFSYNLPQRRINEDRKTEQKWVPKKKLSEEEKEKRRQEMMENATWRNKERERNIKQYHEEERKELSNEKIYNRDFIRKQLVAAAEVGTVASRIKSNINNIQRSCRAMDTNFAKR
ncbi:pre-mRNA-splicing factor CWC25 homolog [Vespa crabro]|uniref:pre-mRNA-splicing factor CWC25 homolog n=1 Tax=Vespa crabro TaxID=7445 RepID=UPI001F012B7A|nr:pre-mRNA-splicing factor CWC25 homolog [Vespa crabro]